MEKYTTNMENSKPKLVNDYLDYLKYEKNY